MNYQKYLDKVVGCYFGKSIGGTFGTPYEGMKQTLEVSFDKSVIRNILMNDDLDLQVLFFQAVKKYGVNINSDEMARLFYRDYPMSPGEYAFFKKNYERGINPPYSGSFNNDFYSEGMGCCIRGELWGCLFPSNPDLAAKFSTLDGCLDHSTESVISEQFVSRMIALCFEEDDIHVIIRRAAEALPKSRFRSMIFDIMEICQNEDDINVLRDAIITKYGHPDCTNVFQNNGVIIACLLMYFDDFERMCEKANYCGFDTDCTVGISAAVYGAVKGAAAFKAMYNVEDVTLALGARCYDYDKSVRAFAEDVAKYGVYFCRLNQKMKFTEAPKFKFEIANEVMFSLKKYSPVLDVGENTEVKIKLSGVKGIKAAELFLDVPDGFEGRITAFDKNIVTISCSMGNRERFCDKNIFTLNVRGKSFAFGFYTPQILYVSKPFFENFYHVELAQHHNYKDYFATLDRCDDAIRDYHISYNFDFEKPYLDMERLSSGDYSDLTPVKNRGDRIEVSNLIAYNGPCVLYIVREIFSDEDKTVRMLFGWSDFVDIYLNGEKILHNRMRGYFTYEKYHLPNVNLKKGRNVLAMKVLRTNDSAQYSATITEPGDMWFFPKHMLGFYQRSGREVKR